MPGSRVGTFEALFSTAHGQSLLWKLALLVPLLAIAAINLLILRPRIAVAVTGRAPRFFLTNVRAEAALAALLLPVHVRIPAGCCCRGGALASVRVTVPR